MRDPKNRFTFVSNKNIETMNEYEFGIIEKKLVDAGVPEFEAPTLAIKVYYFAKQNDLSIDEVIEQNIELTIVRN